MNLNSDVMYVVVKNICEQVTFTHAKESLESFLRREIIKELDQSRPGVDPIKLKYCKNREK